MFERYTEKARRVIFFARYEACQYGSSVIDMEHLLLGLLREDKTILRWVDKAEPEAIRKTIESKTTRMPPISTSVDLPLSCAAKSVLHHAATEADRLNHKYIGTEHLFLALADEKSSFIGKLLRESGVESPEVREQLAARVSQHWSSFQRGPQHSHTCGIVSADTVEIHGTKRNADYVRDVVGTVRSYNWHWHKAAWKPRDIVIRRSDGTFSFELSLAEDSANFTLVKNGWTKDHCFVCRWELFEAEDEHGTGYTNGRSWLCMECYERFVQRPDFFLSSQSEMT